MLNSMEVNAAEIHTASCEGQESGGAAEEQHSATSF